MDTSDIRFVHSFMEDSSIDPASVATLHLEKEFDTGLAIYRTEASLESRDDLIRVLFSHYNKDSYPWKQLLNDDYLNYIWDHPCRVAFVDGHPVAFNYDVNDPWWWNPYDVGTQEISGSIKLKADPLGRSVEAVFNEDGTVRYKDVFRIVDRFYLERFESVDSNVPESITVSLFDVTTDIPEKFIIKEGTTIIGWQAFAKEKNLKEVYIPGSVKDIESFAFYGCDGLERIIVADNLDKSLVSKISSKISKTLPHCKILTESEFAVQILEPFFDKDVFGRLSVDNPIVSVETDKLCCDFALSSASGKPEVFILAPGLDEPIGRFVDYIGPDGALRYDDIINDIMMVLAERDLMESNELSAEETFQIKI